MKKILVIAVVANGTDFFEIIASTLARSGLKLMITSPGLGVQVMDTVSPDGAVVMDNQPQLDG